MRIVYIDSYFFLNLMMNIIIIYLTAALIKEDISLKRCLFSAATGAVVGVAALLSDNISGRLLLGTFGELLMLKICFCSLNFRGIVKGMFYMTFSSLLINGIINWLYFDCGLGHFGRNIDMASILALAVIIGSIMFIYIRVQENKKTRIIMKICIRSGKTDIQLNPLLDTGNQLHHKGKPVHIIDSVCLEKYPEWANDNCEIICASSVGGDIHMKVYICPQILISSPKGIVTLADEYVAVSTKRLSANGDFEFILNSDVSNKM